MLLLLLTACGTPAPVAPAEVPAEEVGPAVPAPAARPTRVGRGPEEEGPPRIEGVTITPANPTAADALHVTQVVTGNPGPSPVWDYVWTVNGREVSGAISENLAPGKARRGDKVSVTVSLSGMDPPVRGTSPEITITNQPPRLLSNVKDLPFVDGLILKAEDPDGDPISWRLEGAPPGMTIDAKGILHYRGSPAEKGGKYQVKIIAEDTGHDFVAVDLPLTLTPGSDAVRAAEEEKKKAEAENKKASG